MASFYELGDLCVLECCKLREVKHAVGIGVSSCKVGCDFSRHVRLSLGVRIHRLHEIRIKLLLFCGGVCLPVAELILNHCAEAGVQLFGQSGQRRLLCNVGHLERLNTVVVKKLLLILIKLRLLI